MSILSILGLLIGLYQVSPGGGFADTSRTRVVEGHIVVRVADDFEGRRAWQTLLLRDDSTGEVYRLEFPAARSAPLRTGDRVIASGALAGEALQVRSITTEPGPAARDVRGQAELVNGGLQSVVLIVDLVDSVVTCSPAQIADTVYSGAASVDALYQEMSFGLVSFPGDTDQDGQPDVFGPFAVAASKDTCDPEGWANAADAAAQAAGVNLALYGFKMYVLPNDVACPWAGLGYLGDESQISPTSCFSSFQLQCRSWNLVCQSGPVFAHELGHNVGMLHSSNDLDNDGYVDLFAEYSDFSDVMGCCGFFQVNAPHRIEMGWLQAVPVTASGIFSLAPLEFEPADTTLPQVLKIRDLYFLSYRRPIGFDAGLTSPYLEATNIHRQKYLFEFSPDPPFDLVAGRFLGNTLWLAGLDDGETFADPANGVTVRQLSHSPEEAIVEVTLADPPGMQFHTVTPCRWFDTRSSFIGAWPLLSAEERIFRVAGRCGVPVSARGLAVNITVTEPTGTGHLTFYPAQLLVASTSSINFAGGRTLANNAVLPLSPDGYQSLGARGHVGGSGQLHLIVDITGYFE